MNTVNVTLLLILIFTLYTQILAQDLDSEESTHESWEYTLVNTGDVLQIALPVAAGLTTIFAKDWEGSKQFTYSFLTTFAVTHILKNAVGKKRPEGREDFDSFPSGHTSSAFQGASFIQQRYGWRYGWIAYLLAVVVGVSRVEGPDGYHDYWDVLGGAIIGVASTYAFTKPYNQHKMDLSFSSSKGQYRLSFIYNF